MSYRDEGGPAFPTDEMHDEHKVGVINGMSLRDYFAANALQGLFQGSFAHRVICTADAERWAENAYAFADAMLKERAK